MPKGGRFRQELLCLSWRHSGRAIRSLWNALNAERRKVSTRVASLELETFWQGYTKPLERVECRKEEGFDKSQVLFWKITLVYQAIQAGIGLDPTDRLAVINR